MSIRYNGSNKVISGKKYIRFNGHTKYKEAITPTFDGLCFTATQSNSSVGYSVTGTVDTSGIQVSTNGTTWTSWDGNTISLSNIGDKIYVKNLNNILSNSSSNYFKFIINGLVSATGNVMSLINYSNIYRHCFNSLFNGCSSLTTAPELPATTLANYCYRNMFKGCSSLTTAPELPATTLYESCYYSMFNGCSSLTTAPELLATTLAYGCYQQMFNGCSSLTTAPELPATTLEPNCYNAMFYGCSSLTTAPELPATTLTTSCYFSMFGRCSSLNVSDTQTSETNYEWKIPKTNNFNSNITLSSMFFGCLGTRSTDDLIAISGQSKTYYTQNQPV